MFYCFDRSPLPCNDCRGCHKIDGCALKDIDDFYNLLESADILVFATPIYNLSFPAPMKALIDRTQCYWSARFIHGERPTIIRPKQTVLITTCGSDNNEGSEMIERQLKPVLTVLNARLTQSVHYTGADMNKPLDTFIEMVKDAADKIVAK
jgi:multimeric flavodoxin WrbA